MPPVADSALRRSWSTERCTPATPGMRTHSCRSFSRRWPDNSREPERELAGRALGRVAAVHQVLLHGEAPVAAEVAPDRSGSGRRRVGRARQRAESLDHAVAGDAQGDHGAALHELHQGLVERLALVLGVVLGEQFAVGLQHPDVHQLVALGLDAAQDLTGQVARDAVGLDDDKGLFGLLDGGGHGVSPSGSVAAGSAASGWAAKNSRRLRSIWRPRTKHQIQNAAKPAPTTYIAGVKMPRAISAA